MHKEADIRPRFLAFNANDQALFAQRLSVYLSAGVPILEALGLLREDARPGAARILGSLLDAVSEGRSISSALRSYSRQISLFAISLIEVGERSGTLQESLAFLAATLRKQQALRQKLVGALIYPAIIVFATLGISSFLILYAFPKIVPLFRGFGSTLPFATRSLILISDILSKYGLLIVLAFMGLSGTAFFLLRKPRIRLIFDRVLLRIPAVGSLVRNYYLANLSRTLSTLLRSGVTIVPALELASATAGNRAYAQSILAARDRTLAGERVSDALRADLPCFPRMYVQMIGTGERTGSLPASFAMLADHHEEEFDAASESLSSLIEPVLMIVMGLLVGFIALAIITPVYQITQSMHG